MIHYTYILQCADGSFYTGWTMDLNQRLMVHNSGKGAKYTRGRRPVRLVYVEVFTTKGAALKREAAIKKLSRNQKIQLIRSFPIAETLRSHDTRFRP